MSKQSDLVNITQGDAAISGTTGQFDTSLNVDGPITSDGLTVGTAVYPTSGALSNRNKIINGAMVIDQRNAGASVTPTDGQYVIDRWKQLQSVASKYSVQQNAGSVTPPAGFANYLGVTSLSAYSVASGDYFAIIHEIEGYNSADLSWGTASAATITVSFWVRSSLTGTFGGSIGDGSNTRSYPFTYTISSSNSWEKKIITVPGDTSGTWPTTNGIGLRVKLGLGVGSTFSGTAGAWAGANYVSATGATSVVSTNGATFYITGVQLEAGDTATPFEHRSYGQELALCMRYYQKLIGQFTDYGISGKNQATYWTFPVVMRATPTVVLGVGSLGTATETLTTQVFGYYQPSPDSARIASGTTASAEL